MVATILGILILTAVIVSILGGALGYWVSCQGWSTRLSANLAGMAVAAGAAAVMLVVLNPDPPAPEARVSFRDVLPMVAVSGMFWVPGVLAVASLLRRAREGVDA